MPFVFSDDARQTAMDMARAHVNQYYRNDTYDEQQFDVRSQFLDLNEAREVTRQQLKNRRTENILDSGIYLIVADNNETVYVGLANNFYSRFNTGYTSHNDECPNNCAHYGHFVNPTEGSRRVGMPDGNCRYILLEMIDHDGFGISQAEIDWYYLFRSNGWQERDSRVERRITNHQPSLGMKGHRPSPCIVMHVSSGNHMFFVGQGNAADSLGVIQPHLNSSIRQFQNQQGGYTARDANPEEVVEGTVVGIKDVIWRYGQSGSIIEDIREACPGCAGGSTVHRRGLRMFWNGGALSELEIAHLQGTRRRNGDGTYDEEIPKSDYKQVSWDSSHRGGIGGWQARAKRGATSRMVNLWRAGPRLSIRTEDDAALIRERAILDNNWQNYCRGRTGSNANLLNERLTDEERGGQLFVDWEEDSDRNGNPSD